MKVDILILNALVSASEVAKYVVVVRISELFYFVPVAFYAAIYPKASTEFKTSRQQGLDFVRHQCKILLIISLAIMIGVILSGRLIISIVAGPEYRDAYRVLCVHILGFIGVSAGLMREVWILLEGTGRLSLYSTICGAVLNIALNMYLDPLYGAMGAAIATTVAYIFVGFAFPFFNRTGRSFIFGKG